VGSAIARDLGADAAFAVSVFDRDAGACERLNGFEGVSAQAVDLSDWGALGKRLTDFDLVVGAVPGWMGFQMLSTVIKSGRNVVDISFFEEDPFRLDELAKEHGVTAVVDCGVAPGISNMVLGRLEQRFERLDKYICQVGGLPQEPEAPWNYKAPYSPSDVIEMYTRPARFRRGGEVITMPALTEPDFIDFPGVGRLESFNTDGLRTLLHTSKVPDVIERTLRYPGHREMMEAMAESGFFSHDPMDVKGHQVSPFDLSSQLLFKSWFQGPKDYDVTAMRLEAEGLLDGKEVRLTYDICDLMDREQGITSMARTTAYPCTAVARMLAQGTYVRPGISPPEYLGEDEATYEGIMSELKKRNVILSESLVDLS
jgi:lysine 6-dehydrogenase